LVEQSYLSKQLFFFINIRRGEKHLRKQRNCKLCQEQWIANAVLSLHHCEKLSYREIIERMRPYIAINEYNLSTHFSRHVEQKDIIEAEESNARWERFKTERLAKKQIDKKLQRN